MTNSNYRNNGEGNNNTPSFEIVQPIQVLGEWRNEDRKISNWREVNKVSWNGSAPRIDIRSWFAYDDDGVKKAGKGVSLNDKEAHLLCKALVDLGYANPPSPDMGN